jgi:hypothetical protein
MPPSDQESCRKRRHQRPRFWSPPHWWPVQTEEPGRRTPAGGIRTSGHHGGRRHRLPHAVLLPVLLLRAESFLLTLIMPALILVAIGSGDRSHENRIYDGGGNLARHTCLLGRHDCSRRQGRWALDVLRFAQQIVERCCASQTLSGHGQ